MCDQGHGVLRILCLFVGLLFSVWVSADEGESRPNIVILIADDLGWDDLGAYGNDFVRTPHIDALAEQGLRFDNAFLTTATCSPSRGSILTGRYPHSNGSMHLHQGLPAHEVTVARHLREAGYFTASVGKWHVGRHAGADFDLMIDDRDSRSGAGRWLEVLRDRPADRPFFLWLAARDPHRDYDDDEADLLAPLDEDSIVPPWGFVDDAATRRELAQYYREVERFDYYVGQVVAQLRADKLLDSTVVIVMSDNGRPFHFGKLTLYDDGIKTPFIVHWPAAGVGPGTREGLLSAIDIAPFIMEVAGLEAAPEMQGVSFMPLLLDHQNTLHEEVFAERNWHGRDAHERAVRSREYLYKVNQFPEWGHCYRSQFGSSPAFQSLRTAHENGDLEGWLDACFDPEWPREELYRIEDDRIVWRNLVDSPDHQDALQRYRQKLSAWRKSTDDVDFEPWQRERN